MSFRYETTPPSKTRVLRLGPPVIPIERALDHEESDLSDS